MKSESNNIHQDLAQIALDKVEGIPFEKFGQEFLSATRGQEFIPTGGYKDGGIDGIIEPGTFEQKGKLTSFAQISIAKDHRAKIRQTITRIREVGRDVKTLLYFTSKTISNHDIEAEDLSEESDVTIRIRDGKFIIGQINYNSRTIDAFKTHMSGSVAFLSHVGSAQIIEAGNSIPNPAVYVFLEQELERRSGKTSLVDTVSDSLILWGLEGTDPDKNIFITKDELTKKIIEALPAAEVLLPGTIQTRLDALSSKEADEKRIRYHKNKNAYCLPYEMRELLAEENQEDEALRINVKINISERIIKLLPSDQASKFTSIITKIVLTSIYKVFENKGLEFCSFLENKNDSFETVAISHFVWDEIERLGLDADEASVVSSTSLNVLGEILYHSTENERLFLTKLSRTYSLLFTLQAEPRLVEYFQNMSADFNLLLGTDILIRALSEQHLHETDQMTCNLIKMLIDSGANIVLTGTVLEEVINHIKSSDTRYSQNYANIDQYISMDIARVIDKILIRAYFYAKLNKSGHQSFSQGWGNYIDNFFDYKELNTEKGKIQLTKYLQEKFKFEFIESEALKDICDLDEVEKLAEDLNTLKGNINLANNDALMVHSVYNLRNKKGESKSASIFGYRTWWLTTEAAILSKTRNLVRSKGSPYLMRPEFLLHFISLAPSMATIRKTYRSIFPTVLGIRLSDRIEPAVLNDMLSKAEEAEKHDEARLKVLMGDVADKLKSDFNKKY